MKIRPKWDPQTNLYDQFAMELADWSETGVMPPLADQDSGYYLALQKARLEKKHLQMKLALEKSEKDPPNVHHYPGRHYEHRWEYAPVRKLVEYSRDGKRLYRKKSDQVFYQMVTDADMPDGIGERPYSCPNCGAVTRVAELTKGCPYCGTRFLMNELFPKVTDYYFIRMDSIGTSKKKIALLMGICIIITYLYLLFQRGAAEGLTPAELIFCLLQAVPIGAFAGLMLTAPVMLISMIALNSSKSIPFRAVMTKNKIQRFMEKLDPNFSYEYFEGQVMSLLRMVVLSGDVKNLAVFDGTERSDCFDNVIDMVYEGGMVVRGLYQDGSFCTLDLRAYMLDTYDEGKIYTRSDSIDFTVVRSMGAKIAPGFSIRLVNCKNCGGSFDASHQKKCPYCGTDYEMKRESWVITRAVRNA